MAERIRIYHNPRCSKSRQALALLQEAGVEPEIVLYLETPPDAAELARLLGLLRLPAADLVRRGEEEFKQHFRGRDLDEAGWIDAMVRFPRLIERPIVAWGGRAVIARPPERVREILDRAAGRPST